MGDDRQKVLIAKIVHAEVEKVRNETAQLLRTIQIESEERLRQNLNVFQQKEAAMQDAFDKAISRAEAYGKRKAEQDLKQEMEALIERIRIAEEELSKERASFQEKENEWKKERFEWQVCVERALMSERGYKKGFMKT